MRLNQHAPFLQVVEVWLKERAVIEPKSETGLKVNDYVVCAVSFPSVGLVPSVVCM